MDNANGAIGSRTSVGTILAPSNRRSWAGIPLLYRVALSQTIIRLCPTFRTPAAPHAPVTCSDIRVPAKRAWQQNSLTGTFFLRLPITQQCTTFKLSHFSLHPSRFSDRIGRNNRCGFRPRCTNIPRFHSSNKTESDRPPPDKGFVASPSTPLIFRPIPNSSLHQGHLRTNRTANCHICRLRKSW